MSMDKNNDGQISKARRTQILFTKVLFFLYQMIVNIDNRHQGELKLARKNLTMKQIESIIKKLDNNGDGTISLEEMKKGK